MHPKYKGSFFGAAWSVLNPLMTLLIMRVVFGHFFGSGIPHFTTYLFCGTVVFSFFSESSSEGLMALVGNAPIFTKVNVPKYLFLLSKNTQTLINFALTLCVFFLFCTLDGVKFSWRFFALLYPVSMLLLFNLGMGFILSALSGYAVFLGHPNAISDVSFRDLLPHRQLSSAGTQANAIG